MLPHICQIQLQLKYDNSTRCQELTSCMVEEGKGNLGYTRNSESKDVGLLSLH